MGEEIICSKSLKVDYQGSGEEGYVCGLFRKVRGRK